MHTAYGQYTGQWRDGSQHGHGSAHYQDGAHYRGEWVQGVASGAGRLQLPNRDVYEGDTWSGLGLGLGLVFRLRVRIEASLPS